ncbi:hypothetical protein EVAR_96524_1 [Eumeta japonica]|uniref:Uncharacterized protein n=1 Tax=Eumeta variegata TaxID=151549 RepID=A0A4C1WGG5_EUMVA|nr:hypothetical protein EVAR_96524_1 [Eumeta japonica]
MELKAGRAESRTGPGSESRARPESKLRTGLVINSTCMTVQLRALTIRASLQQRLLTLITPLHVYVEGTSGGGDPATAGRRGGASVRLEDGGSHSRKATPTQSACCQAVGTVGKKTVNLKCKQPNKHEEKSAFDRASALAQLQDGNFGVRLHRRQPNLRIAVYLGMVRELRCGAANVAVVLASQCGRY